MRKGDKCFSHKDHKTYTITGTTTHQIGDREVVMVQIQRYFKKKELFADEVVVHKRKSDIPFFGWLFGR